MNAIEKKKFGMYGEVLSLLTKNTALFLSLSQVPFLMTKLSRTIDEIEKIDRSESSAVLELKIENDARRNNLIADITSVSLVLLNYARQSSDAELRDKSRFSQSHLVRLPDAELLSMAEAIRLLALKYVSELRRMGITPNVIYNLGLKIEFYRRSLEKKVSQPKTDYDGLHLSGLFLIADQIIENTDKLMKPLSDNSEGFYHEYICARNFENQDERKALLDLMEDEEK